MVGYLDSSVLLQNCDAVISSELLKIECAQAVYRHRLEGRIDEHGFFSSLMRLEEALEGISIIKLVDEIKIRAAESFPMVIKTLDALHLSTALAYQNRLHDDRVLIFSFDRQLNRCARALGFSVPFLTEYE